MCINICEFADVLDTDDEQYEKGRDADQADSQWEDHLS